MAQRHITSRSFWGEEGEVVGAATARALSQHRDRMNGRSHTLCVVSAGLSEEAWRTLRRKAARRCPHRRTRIRDGAEGEQRHSDSEREGERIRWSDEGRERGAGDKQETASPRKPRKQNGSQSHNRHGRRRGVWGLRTETKRQRKYACLRCNAAELNAHPRAPLHSGTERRESAQREGQQGSRVTNMEVDKSKP